MQESASMHKSPTPARHSCMNQARPEKRKREEDRKDRGHEADEKKGSPTKQNTSEELKQGLPIAQLRLKKKKTGEGTPPAPRDGYDFDFKIKIMILKSKS